MQRCLTNSFKYEYDSSQKLHIDHPSQTELTNLDDTIYGTCTYEQIFDPAFVREGGSFDWPGPGATLVEVTSQESTSTGSRSMSSHIQTPEAGIMIDNGSILTDVPTSASATLEQLLQSIDPDSFLLASGYGDLMQFPLV
jgi:hypothetical protein